MKSSKTVDDSVKFAWAYLLTHGVVTDGKWSYYGGMYEPVLHNVTENLKLKEEIREKAVSVGINWDKTDIPKVDTENVFNGTFATTAGWETATLGKLVLLNGETFIIGSSDDNAAHLAEAARELLRGKDSWVQSLADKL